MMVSALSSFSAINELFPVCFSSSSLQCTFIKPRQSRWRKMAFNFDLNQCPGNERNGIDESNVTLSLSIQTPPSAEVREVIDEEVAIISPAAFAEARAKSRRNNRNTTNLLNAGAAGPDSNNVFPQNSERGQQPETHREIMMRESSGTEVSPAPTEVRCPICRGELVEETSTKCGHIFCKRCITAALVAQRKCPTCRQKISFRGLTRVYIPTTYCEVKPEAYVE